MQAVHIRKTPMESEEQLQEDYALTYLHTIHSKLCLTEKKQGIPQGFGFDPSPLSLMGF